MKRFEDFIDLGIVKKVTIDSERAKSLAIEAERKIISLNESLDKIGIKGQNANDFVEYCYDIIMLLIRAKLYTLGYSSRGQGAHEAEVAYLYNLGFYEQQVRFVDQMRFFRNGMLYYGKLLDKEYAEKVVEFSTKMFNKLRDTL